MVHEVTISSIRPCLVEEVMAVVAVDVAMNAFFSSKSSSSPYYNMDDGTPSNYHDVPSHIFLCNL